MKNLKSEIGKTLRISLVLLLLLTTASCGGDGGGSPSSADTTTDNSDGGSSGGSGSDTTAALTWTAPATNADGTLLTDLAGYKVYFGTSSGNYPEQINIGMPSCTDMGSNVTECAYDVQNLESNTYYFAVTAYDASGNESDYSNEAAWPTP